MSCTWQRSTEIRREASMINTGAMATTEIPISSWSHELFRQIKASESDHLRMGSSQVLKKFEAGDISSHSNANYPTRRRTMANWGGRKREVGLTIKGYLIHARRDNSKRSRGGPGSKRRPFKLTIEVEPQPNVSSTTTPSMSRLILDQHLRGHYPCGEILAI